MVKFPCFFITCKNMNLSKTRSFAIFSIFAIQWRVIVLKQLFSNETINPTIIIQRMKILSIQVSKFIIKCLLELWANPAYTDTSKLTQNFHRIKSNLRWKSTGFRSQNNVNGGERVLNSSIATYCEYISSFLFFPKAQTFRNEILLIFITIENIFG